MKNTYQRGTWTIAADPPKQVAGLIHSSGLFGISGQSVTHIPSGLSFGNYCFRLQRHAKAFIADVWPLLDWSKVTLEDQSAIDHHKTQLQAMKKIWENAR